MPAIHLGIILIADIEIFHCGKTHISLQLSSYFSIQFSDIKYTHIVVQPS